jgi:hypothetical protein
MYDCKTGQPVSDFTAVVPYSSLKAPGCCTEGDTCGVEGLEPVALELPPASAEPHRDMPFVRKRRREPELEPSASLAVLLLVEEVRSMLDSEGRVSGIVSAALPPSLAKKARCASTTSGLASTVHQAKGQATAGEWYCHQASRRTRKCHTASTTYSEGRSDGDGSGVLAAETRARCCRRHSSMAASADGAFDGGTDNGTDGGSSAGHAARSSYSSDAGGASSAGAG